MTDPVTLIRRKAQEQYEKLRAIRRHLHRHPELSFQEFKTSQFIQDQLIEAGIAFKTGYVKTGIVALIEGKNPGKRTVLLRADMDALPIEEKNEVEYRSQNPGVMHACGHDVHSTCVLGAALLLQQLRNEFEGTVKIMFQPGEEVLPGGASLMIEEGVLENPKVDKAIALHVFPSLQAGNVGFRPGMYMASTDELYLTVKGKGGHAAMPDDYINPLIIASEMLIAINRQFMNTQDLKVSPGEKIPTVVAFGNIEGKGATNVIPDEVIVAGTCRTMDEAWRRDIHRRLFQIVEEISAQYGIKSELRIETGYPCLVNDIDFTESCTMAARHYLGHESVSELPLRMTAEDFSFISQKVPSCFFRLGTAGINNAFSSGVHTATFDIDERALVTGAGLLTWLALSELKK